MSTPRVVLIGLPPNSKLIPADVQPYVAKALAALETQMADAGIEYLFVGAPPDEGLAPIASKLEAHRPDIVVIGNGIRRDMELTPWMEQIIDTLRTRVPHAKLGFNTTPENTLDAVRRFFPTAAAAKST